MTRVRYIFLSLALVAVLALIGIWVSPTNYQIWLVGRLTWHGVMLDSLYALEHALYLKEVEAFNSGAMQAMDVWLPFKLSIAALLAPAVPAFLRLRILGMHWAWGLLGLLPGLNFLFFVYLAMRRNPGEASEGVRWPAVVALFPLGVVAGYALYSLLMYVPWLAAKS